MRMISRRIKGWLSAFFKRFQRGAKQQPALLPARRPLFPELRPGRQHCEIHDPDYLEQILMAEHAPDAPEEKPSAHDR